MESDPAFSNMAEKPISSQPISDHLDSHSTPSTRDSVSSFTSTPARSLSASKKTLTPVPANLLPSAPASPPTPAPSPTPHQRPPSWQSSDDEENTFLLNLRIHFSTLSNARKQKILQGILDVCDSQQLSFVSSYVGPRLRKDPFQVFPNELCLRVRHSPSPLCAGRMSDADQCSTLTFRSYHLSTIPRPSREHRKYPDAGANCSTMILPGRTSVRNMHTRCAVSRKRMIWTPSPLVPSNRPRTRALWPVSDG